MNILHLLVNMLKIIVHRKKKTYENVDQDI